MKKIVLLCVLFFGLTSVTFSQTKKIEKKAKTLTEKINSEIIASDKTLALTEEQSAAIVKVHLDRLTELKKLGKSATKEEKKAINKKYNQKIHKEILSKKQLKARRKGKQKSKE